MPLLVDQASRSHGYMESNFEHDFAQVPAYTHASQPHPDVIAVVYPPPVTIKQSGSEPKPKGSTTISAGVELSDAEPAQAVKVETEMGPMGASMTYKSSPAVEMAVQAEVPFGEKLFKGEAGEFILKSFSIKAGMGLDLARSNWWSPILSSEVGLKVLRTGAKWGRTEVEAAMDAMVGVQAASEKGLWKGTFAPAGTLTVKGSRELMNTGHSLYMGAELKVTAGQANNWTFTFVTGIKLGWWRPRRSRKSRK